MQRSILHITQNNERWDTLAYRYYGNAYLYHIIIQANKHLVITGEIPAGTKVNIPIINETDIPTSDEDMPPWMRNNG